MKKVIISIHDVSPCFKSEITTILNHFEETSLSLLVRPLWDGEHRLTTDFVKILRGSEKILHGLKHANQQGDWAGKLAAFSKRSDRELYGLSHDETWDLIAQGKQLFEDAFDESPLGFVPPTWYHNSHSVGLLREMGFGFTEKPFQLLDLEMGVNEGFCIKTPAVCYDYGNNSWAERLSIGFWRQFLTHFSPDLVRISIHPSDVQNGFLPHFDTLFELLKTKGYAFQNYQAFFNDRKSYDFNYHLYPQ
jgi:predicted deacetylase